MTSPLLIGLSAVLVAAEAENPRVLVIRRPDAANGLPFGAFDPDRHRTFDLSLRGWVREQTGFELGYVEQLYTFGDKDRETPAATLSDAPSNARVISVGYLALTPSARPPDAGFEASWHDWYRYFPWEDHRKGRPEIIDAEIAPRLMTWAVGNTRRMERAKTTFALDDHRWMEEHVLARFELLYEAGLVGECARDVGLAQPDVKLGETMASDHRRILATAISRLRGKLKYRPIVFELMPPRFTLSALQRTVEAILGLNLHTQNFRRALEKTGYVEGTGIMETSTGGRPAEFFQYRRGDVRSLAATGIATPRLNQEN